MKLKLPLLLILFIVTFKMLYAQVPTISYSSPQNYPVNTVITPLAPTGSGVASPGYSSKPVTVAVGFNIVAGLAVDVTGNIYVADFENNAVEKIPVGGGSPIVIASGFSYVAGVTVDVAGNVYFSDDGNNSVYKVPAGGGSPVIIGLGFQGPSGLAVDAAGNVYVADFRNSAIKKIPVGGGTPVTLGSGFSQPNGVAVDASGNVYIADTDNNAIKEIPAGGSIPIVLSSGINSPNDVAVDAGGNVYFTDTNNFAVKEIPVGGTSPVTIGSGINTLSLAVDAIGNVYVSNSNNSVYKIVPVGGYYISPALPKGLKFNDTTGTISGTPAVASSATNYTITGYNTTGNNKASVNIAVIPPGTIVFPKLPAAVYGKADFSPAATSNNTVTPITYTSSNNSVATITATGNIHILAAGTSTITASQAGSANYSAAVPVTQTLTVSAAQLTITAANQTKTYGAANPTLTAAYSGFVNGDTPASLTTQPALSTTATSASSAGTYPIAATGAVSANYTIAYVQGTLIVGKAALAITAVNQTKTYGSANPVLTTSYTGFVNGDTQSSLSTQPTISTTALTTALPGKYPIIVSGAADANYTISYLSGSLTVNPATLTVTASNQIKTYGAVNPALTFTYTGFVNGDTKAIITTAPVISTTALTTSPAGTYPVTTTGAVANANYTISYVAGTLTVGKAALTITALNQSKTYGAANPTLTAAYSGFVNGDTPASLIMQPVISTTATTASPVGAYTIAVSGAGAANYNITYLAGTLTVGKAPLTITATNQSKTYGAANPALTFSCTGFVNADTQASLTTLPTVSTTATQTSAAGTYAITAAGAASANYAITYAAGTFTIGKAVVTITAANKSKVYGAANPVFSVVYNGFVNGDTQAVLTTQPTISTAATTSSPVGAYPITTTGAAAANYSFTYVNGTLTVTATPFTFAAIPVKVYGTADFSPAAVSTGSITYTSSNSAVATIVLGNIHIIGAGSSTITASSGGSVLTQMLTVTPAALTITAVNQTKVYGSVNPALTVTYTGFVNGDTKTSLTTQPGISTTALTSSPAGAYPIIATGAAGGNYTISYIPGTLTVGKAALTITAVNQTKTYGAANPILTVTYSGFVNGDTQTSLTAHPALSTTATAVSVAGTYPITATGAASANYAISYVAGTLTVGKAALTIAAANQTKTYASANPILTVTYSGFVNGDTQTSLSTQPTISTTALTTSAAGTYTITVAGAVDANYNISYVAGTLTVNPATLTVTVNNQSKTYGAVNPALTVNYTGLVNGDTQNIITKAPAISTTALTTSPAGTYPVTATGAVANANYTISYVAGTLTVGKAALTITAVNQSKTYGTANPTLTVTYSGFVNGDSQPSLTTQPATSTTATAASPVGSYPITATGAASANYAITYAAGTLTIGKAALTITAVNQSRVYGSANPTLTVTFSGFVNGDAPTSLTTQPAISTTATALSPIGAYPITATAAVDPNYMFTYVAGTLTVGRAALTITPNNQTKDYNTPNPVLTVTYSGFVNGDTQVSLTTQPSISTTATTTSAAGVYPIIANGAFAVNYSINYIAGTLTIVNPVAPTLSYAGQQTFTAGTAIAPIVPVSSGVAAQSYSVTPVNIGSGYSYPYGVSADAAGNLYIADTFSSTIKEIKAGGGTTTVGSGFNDPTGVAADAAGNVFVADFNNSEVKKVPAGNGSPVGLANPLSLPFAVAVDAGGNVYFTQPYNNAVSEITGNEYFTIGSGFNQPRGVAADAAGNIYVADAGDNSVKKFIASGSNSPVTIGSGFNAPWGVAVDAAGNVYVADTKNNAIKEIPAGGGTPITLGAGFNGPTGVAVDGAGNVYVADFGNNAVKKISPLGGYYISPALPAGLTFNGATGVISGTPASASPATNYTIIAYNSFGSTKTIVSIAVNKKPAPKISYPGPQAYIVNNTITSLVPNSSGVAVPGYSTLPSLIAYGLHHPSNIALDTAGNIYVADGGDSSIKKIPALGGIPVTVATGHIMPLGITVDRTGNIYYTDSYYPAIIREIPVGGGFFNIGGAGFKFPAGLAVDTAGVVYVADQGNNAVEKIPVSVQSSVPIALGFDAPSAVAVDAAGNVYVADSGNSAVKEIPNGNGAPVTIGSGFSYPKAIAVDATGNVYVGDTSNGEVKEIITGHDSTITIGSGFSLPYGVAVDGAGNVYVSDAQGNTVSKVAPVGGYYIRPSLPPGLSFNNTTGVISGTPTALSPATNYTITAYNSVGTSTATVSIAIIANTIKPVISYTGPQTYTEYTTIKPLVPTSSDVAAKGYSTPVLVARGLNSPQGLAVDTAGNIYFADTYSLEKIPVGSNSPVKIFSNANNGNLRPLMGMALDVAGNVYVSAGNLVEKFLSGGGGPIPLGSGFTSPAGVAVDAQGNVYVADKSTGFVTKIPVSGAGNVIIGSGFSSPTGVAVDGAGNVYVTDPVNKTVTKIPVNGGIPVTIGSGFISPYGIAVDNTGNVFVTDDSNLSLEEIPVGGGSPVFIYNGFVLAFGLAVDKAGNIYLSENGSAAIYKITPAGGYYLSAALPGGLSFNNSTGIISGTPTETSPATPYTITAYNTPGSSPDNMNSSTATVTIAVVSNNASLANLTLSSGTLSPVFAVATTAYTATVANAVSSLTVTPTTSDPTATVKINGTAVTSGTASASLPLSIGANTVSTVVTAGDGKTTETYTITVTRTNLTNASLYISDAAFQSLQLNSASNDEKVLANNILSPNGDGVNDTWLVKNIENYPNNAVTVYDRTGHIVFTKKGYANDWAGTYHGSVLNEGTYYYLVDLGNGTSLKGFITVVRDR